MALTKLDSIENEDFDSIQIVDIPKITLEGENQENSHPSFACLVACLVSKKLPKLQRLNLSNTHLEDKHLIFLLEKVFAEEKIIRADEKKKPSDLKYLEEFFLQNNLLSVDSLQALAKYLPRTDIYYLNLSYNKDIRSDDIMKYLYPILQDTYLFHLYYYNEDTIEASQPSAELLNVFRANEEKWKVDKVSIFRITCCSVKCNCMYDRMV